MKILVTGGAGFIGSHLCEYLLNQGQEVICLDNLFTGSLENIRPLLGNKNFKFLKKDVTKPFFVKADQIYDLACPAAPIHYQFDPVKTVVTNVQGAINVLELAKKNRARVLLSSTSEVYGDPEVHPQKETYVGHVNPIGPRACYDEGKRCAETIFFDYHRQYGVEIKVARIFNTYGPNMAVNDGRVVSNFIIQALRGETLTLFGKGNQTRSFMYIDDLVKGLVALMNSKKELTGPVNLGNPVETTIKEIGEKIISLTNSSSVFAFHPLPEDDPKQRKPDITLAKKELNWEPSVKLEDGLKKTISYFAGKNLIPKRRVLIFSTTYHPFEQEAELSVKQITNRLKNHEFDLVTPRFDKNLPEFEKVQAVNVYRLGSGKKTDKHFFPILGFLRAMRLHKKNSYDMIWVVMASYAGFAGIFFKIFNPRVKYFLSLHEKKSNKEIIRKTWFIYPLYRLIFTKADFVQAIDLSLEQRARKHGATAQSMVMASPTDEKFWDKLSLRINNIFQRLME